MAKTLARTDAPATVANWFEQQWPSAPYATTIRLEKKAAVLPGDTTNPSWAGSLVLKGPSIDVITSTVQRQSVPVRAGFRLVPFGTPVPMQIGGRAVFRWGRPKPVSRLDLDTLKLPMGFLSAIPVFTDELIKLMMPGTEAALQDIFVGELVAAQDHDLLDPAITLIADVRPASLTAGLTPIAGTSDLSADVATLLDALYTARPSTAKPVLIMTPANNWRLAQTSTYRNLTQDVLVVTTPAAGNQVIAADASAVAYADGGLVLDVSREALLQMDDAPTTPDAATFYTSLWQMNLAAFRFERTLWWQAVSGAVHVLTVTP
jgi:hypothetical protein